MDLNIKKKHFLITIMTMVLYTNCDTETKVNRRTMEGKQATTDKSEQINAKRKQNNDPNSSQQQQESTPTVEDDGINPKLELTWNANDEQNLTHYNIYIYTSNPESAQKLLQSVYINENDFDSEYPKKEVVISAEYKGKNPCFVITAINDGGESAKSDQACIYLNKSGLRK